MFKLKYIYANGLDKFTMIFIQVFEAFRQKRDDICANKTMFDLWLNVEAFEYLRNDPCLPVDPAGSGMAELLNRADKSRVDWAIANAGDGFYHNI